MHTYLQYFKFLLVSKNKHAVHSPFIFNFVTKCIKDNTHYKEYDLITKYRQNLINSKDKIEVLDLGEGSKTMKKSERQIRLIAKRSGSSKKLLKLIFRLTRYFNISNILELGTSLGMSSYAMSLGNANAQITTIEGCPQTSAFAQKALEDYNIKNIKFVRDNFNDSLAHIDMPHLDLVFFDGNHNREATLAYFNKLLPKANNNTVFIFDDIYWSRGMTKAWEDIKTHSKVTVTVDLFYWGIVFFRKEQAKQHFRIRL